MRNKLWIALCCGLAAPIVHAQEGGTRVTFGVSTGLTASDNWTLEEGVEESSFQFATDLTFGLSSQTRNSSASIDLGGQLQHTDIAGTETSTGLADPFINARYTRSGVTDEFQIDGRLEFIDQEIDFSDSDGTRTTGEIGTQYSFGNGLPFGGTVAASMSQSRFDNSSDDDESTASASVSLRFETSPNLTITPRVSFVRYEVGDPVTETTDTTTVGIGFNARINDVSSVNVQVSETSIDGPDEETSGLTGSITYQREGQNSTHIFSASQDVSNEGTRTELGYGRRLQFGENSGSYGFGLARGADDTETFTANVDISRPVPDGTFSFGLDRSFQTTVDGEETLTTDLSASYSQDLTDAAGFDISAGYNLEEDAEDDQTANGSASIFYRRSLTNDWALRTGWTYNWTRDEADVEVSSNTLSISLNRTWVSFR